MNRKSDIERKIIWAKENTQEIYKIPQPNVDITESDLDKCMQLTSSAISNLNAALDYYIKDFVEVSGTKISARFYFPFY